MLAFIGDMLRDVGEEVQRRVDGEVLDQPVDPLSVAFGDPAGDLGLRTAYPLGPWSAQVGKPTLPSLSLEPLDWRLSPEPRSP